MGGKNNSLLFFKDKPVFGLDIGSSSIKVMQVERHRDKASVVGYGHSNFDEKAIKDGVIVDLELLASVINDLFKNSIVGHISTRRAVATIPTTRTFTKTVSLPSLRDKQLREAVMLEAEQSIPVPLDQLYLDYSVVKRSKNEVELLVVAVPKPIVDSHLDLMRVLGLESIAFDISIGAAGRLFESQSRNNDLPTVLIDFGSVSADITVHDKTVVITSTVPGGGDIFTDLIAKKLGVSLDEALIIKSKYGLTKSKKQREIIDAVAPDLKKLVKEVQRMIRYYEERSDSKQKIEQLVTMGGGANMPGLSDYLTDALRLPVRMLDPWSNLSLGKLKQPAEVEKSIYVTVAGLSLINTKDLYGSEND